MLQIMYLFLLLYFINNIRIFRILKNKFYNYDINVQMALTARTYTKCGCYKPYPNINPVTYLLFLY